MPTFPKFVIRRSTLSHELRKVMGTSKYIDSSAAFLFDVPVSKSPLVAQERQIGGTRMPAPAQTLIEATGAGEGNRTLVCSLGSCRSAIELRPRSQLGETTITGTARPDQGGPPSIRAKAHNHIRHHIRRCTSFAEHHLRRWHCGRSLRHALPPPVLTEPPISRCAPL